MAHGDDSGLIFPPKIAPVQVIIVPIAVDNWKENVLPHAQDIEEKLQVENLRVKLDAREEFTPGWKFSEWEMRGVPLRIEIGPRDIKAKQVVAVRRIAGKKESIDFDVVNKRIPEILEEIQGSLLEQNKKFMQDNTHQTSSYDEFKDVIESKRGFIKALWCGNQACEDKIKDETMATIRVIALSIREEKIQGNCIHCQDKAEKLVYFARAY